MSFELNQFKVDPSLERDGVWTNLDENAKVLIARTGNSNFQKAYRKIPSGIRRMMENETLSDELASQTMAELMSKTILLDWDGISENGKELKYSVETAKVMLHKYPEFRSVIWDIANQFQIFHNATLEESAKNSKGASNGS